MRYTGYQLLWFFLLYSFIGWCGEVTVAAIKRHKFINRGFVNGPMCPIYGVGAVVFAIFLPELRESLFFLFLGGMILGSAIEYVTGRILERIFHRKWWDYSNERFNADGYVCLKTSLLWGICAIGVIWFVNPAICWLLRKTPSWMDVSVAWVLAALLAVDYAGSAIAIQGLKKNERISQITEELQKTSRLLENTMTRSIQKRMVKAYPNIETGDNTGENGIFAEGCSFYKVICLFFIGGFLGDLVETVFMLLTTHKLVSRTSLVYGQFSLVWGLACALLTLILYRFKDKSDFHIFLVGTVLGGAYEYICSVFTEVVFGTVFWDYSGFAFNLGGRINLLYCFFWGLAAVVWIRMIYPFLSRWIERIPKKAGKILCWIMMAVMVGDMLLSSMALIRYTQRYVGREPQNQAEEYLDGHFPDERMEKIYPYARFRVPDSQLKNP